jgi:3-hydroxyisobutyrate dehydrogenase-like beta-hydroxyacid dehydrogenase
VRIAVIGMGAMGSAVAKSLLSSGAEIVTYLEGRSSSTRKRAIAAGIRDVDITTMLDADIILSIVPPSQALAVADYVATAMRSRNSVSIYIDCNAISPQTMTKVAETFGAGGPKVLDGCIIGGPPMPGKRGPRVYISGGANKVVPILVEYGLDARVLDGDIGASSALKMCYAGINKGLTGLATAMIMAAAKSGADQALMAELAESQSELLAKFSTTIPDMYPKAYRWVAEMQEIAEFLGEDGPGAEVFSGMADVFGHMAADQSSGGNMAATLSRVLEQRPTDASINRYDALSNGNFDQRSERPDSVPSARNSDDRDELQDRLESGFPASDPASTIVTSIPGRTRT